METIEKIKAHIAKGETEKAIKLLVEYTEESNSPRHKDAILLSGQFRQWKREITLGVQQSSGELRRIEMGVMDLVQDKADAAKENTEAIAVPTAKTQQAAAVSQSAPKKRNWGPIIAGLLGVLILGFGLNVFLSDDAHDNGDGKITVVDNPNTDDTKTMGGDTKKPKDKEPEENKPKEKEPEVSDPQVEPPVKDPVPPEPNPADLKPGLTTKEVVYRTSEGKGFFIAKGGGVWMESNNQNTDGIQFAEFAREAGCVYLFDESRDIMIGLNLTLKKVKIRNNEDGTYGDLYDIIEFN